ncbi:hypothetical protein OG453_05835 [Streptomyces sp. NBC_01381]|uniref:hypothetical protein n=1 Tax=Streptomyces sp. NBC_01381 TaxID=2903845 RepID=UPI00225410BE|nr:hypothetical protein [Streptomyces sp. NBC_01381]MCX4666187.1 hypothetical protein [Streptomyces sp. NBC_01381]
MKITKILMTGAAAAAMAGASASGAFAAGPAPSAPVGDKNVGASSVATEALNQAHDNLYTGLAIRGGSESPDALTDVANVAGKIDETGKSALVPGK